MTSKLPKWLHGHLVVGLWTHVGPLWEPKSNPDLIFHDFGPQNSDFGPQNAVVSSLRDTYLENLRFYDSLLLIMLYFSLLCVHLFISFMLLT